MAKTGLQRTDADAAEVVALLKKGDALDVKDLAARHVKPSIGLLRKALKRPKDQEQAEEGDYAPWSVGVKAATTLLEFSSGKPDTREAAAQTTGGLTVIIQNFSGDTSLEKVVEATEVARATAEAVDVEFVEIDTPAEASLEDVLKATFASVPEEG